MAYTEKKYPKRDIYQEITDKIIEEMEKENLPWQKGWDEKMGATILCRPINPISGFPYTKGNAVYLASIGREIDGGKDPRFCSFKAAEKKGWSVRKGAHGFGITQGFKATKDRFGMPLPPEDWHWTSRISVVFHASQLCVHEKILDAAGNQLKDEKGKPMVVEKDIPAFVQAIGYTHAEQMDIAEHMLVRSGAAIHNDAANEAYYLPKTDEIHLPPKTAFPALANYYAVALHELGHWTGHTSRMNRELCGGFGSPSYAKEELRAEMASVYLSMDIGIPFDPSNHAAYTQSWLKILKKDKMEFHRAAADAVKIAAYIQDLVRDKVKVQLLVNEDQKPTMHVKIFQAPAKNCPWTFRSFNELPKNPDFSYYQPVYDGELETASLESLYEKFNATDRPNGQSMRSLSVSDIVQVNDQTYYVDNFGFQKIEIHAQEADRYIFTIASDSKVKEFTEAKSEKTRKEKYTSIAPKKVCKTKQTKQKAFSR
jgi:antirestriction protein ArdC